MTKYNYYIRYCYGGHKYLSAYDAFAKIENDGKIKTVNAIAAARIYYRYGLEVKLVHPVTGKVYKQGVVKKRFPTAYEATAYLHDINNKQIAKGSKVRVWLQELLKEESHDGRKWNRV